MKAALTIASLALVLTGVSGCGDDGPPTDASATEFCDTLGSFAEEAGALGEDPDPADMVDVLKSAGDEMAETGTPEDMPDDARAGFELVLDAIEELDDGASVEEIQGLGEDLSESEQKESDAFDKYLDETCEAE